MPPRLIPAACALAFLTCLSTGGKALGGDSLPAPDSSQELALAFKGLQMGPGIANDQLILFPLYATTEPGAIGVTAVAGTSEASGTRGATHVCGSTGMSSTASSTGASCSVQRDSTSFITSIAIWSNRSRPVRWAGTRPAGAPSP